MTQFPHFKKFTLMKKSKCCNSKIDIGLYSDGEPYNRCIECGEPCEIMEQSESTASDSTQELSAVKLLSELTGIPEYRLLANDNGEFITKSRAIDAMNKFASQKDAQIQALTKEVEIKDRQLLSFIESNNKLIAEVVGLQSAGNKMAEALKTTKEIVESNGYKWLSDESEQALEGWSACNKQNEKTI